MIDTRTFARTYFPTPRILHGCAECGARILNTNGTTLEEQDMGYRRVHFDLSDGTRSFISFCPMCASQPWPQERLDALERQCKYGWKTMQTPGTKPNWTGDHLSFRPANLPVQNWAEVQ